VKAVGVVSFTACEVTIGSKFDIFSITLGNGFELLCNTLVIAFVQKRRSRLYHLRCIAGLLTFLVLA